MRQFVIAVRLRPNSEEEVRGILRQGPPFELEDTGLESHSVFLAADELVFLFEGARAEEEVARLLERSRVLEAASRLRGFSWRRIHDLDGVSFEAQPGPGDSEGGGGD